jgi:triosephosphate isomerase
MKKKVVAGNWKMNTSPAEGIALAEQLITSVNSISGLRPKVIIAPPFTHLTQMSAMLSGKGIMLAAQNCSSYAKGAYTGEVSASMIAACGAQSVIIGHSERRAYFKEDNATLATKVNIALENGLMPIYCCGETLEEREGGKLFDVVKQQIEEGLFHLTAESFAKIMVAYEPVWAIGTGKTATTGQAGEMHEFIRKLFEEKYGEAIAKDLVILYGGSVNASNAKDLFSTPHIDGGLVGGASLKAEEFVQIIKSAV